MGSWQPADSRQAGEHRIFDGENVPLRQPVGLSFRQPISFQKDIS